MYAGEPFSVPHFSFWRGIFRTTFFQKFHFHSSQKRNEETETVPHLWRFLYHISGHFWAPNCGAASSRSRWYSFCRFISLYVFTHLGLIGALKIPLIESQVGTSVVQFLPVGHFEFYFLSNITCFVFYCSLWFCFIFFFCFHVILFYVMLALFQQSRKKCKKEKESKKQRKEDSKERKERNREEKKGRKERKKERNKESKKDRKEEDNNKSRQTLSKDTEMSCF